MNEKRKRPLSLHVAGSTFLISCALLDPYKRTSSTSRACITSRIGQNKKRRKKDGGSCRTPIHVHAGWCRNNASRQKWNAKENDIREVFFNSMNVLSSSVGGDTNEVGDTFSIKWLFFFPFCFVGLSFDPFDDSIEKWLLCSQVHAVEWIYRRFQF